MPHTLPIQREQVRTHMQARLDSAAADNTSLIMLCDTPEGTHLLAMNTTPAETFEAFMCLAHDFLEQLPEDGRLQVADAVHQLAEHLNDAQPYATVQ